MIIKLDKEVDEIDWVRDEGKGDGSDGGFEGRSQEIGRKVLQNLS
jgi:hypothetical protein